VKRFYINTIVVKTIMLVIAITGSSMLACLADNPAESIISPPSVQQFAPLTMHKDGVHEEILIKASPQIVWKSMMEQRKLDPDSQYCKAAAEGTKQVVEQKFVFPSPFGDAECTLHLCETVGQRVDFRLIESEDLKKMEGSWTLTPQNDGKCTRLGLSSYVEPNMSIPRMLTNVVISHKAKKNLDMVKKLAEKSAGVRM